MLAVPNGRSKRGGASLTPSATPRTCSISPGGTEEEAVKVAVRMRPLTEEELKQSATCVMTMVKEEKGSRTVLTNPQTGEDKSFSFDYSFDSSDPSSDSFATQEEVFEALGKPVLDATLEGRNTCLFAYGQTGAGKSFSMLGKSNPPHMRGLIPRICRELFQRRDEEDNELTETKISMQVVEVYCEQVNDLLVPRKTWPVGGNKLRYTKDGYTCDAITWPCFNHEDIEKAFAFADRNRSLGSHALNAESSRAHTIYTINYRRQRKENKKSDKMEVTTCKINLADLAGSERTETARTSGQMLKEGTAINLSLTALGRTIKNLSEGKRPVFRESKLTLLLEGSLTNGKVIMIAALSPASTCFGESISTLRFAERIKQVKIKARQNKTMDPIAELRKEMEDQRVRMQQEIDELRRKLREANGEGGNGKELELRRQLEEQTQMQKDMQDDFERRIREMGQATESWREEQHQLADEIYNRWKTAMGGAVVNNGRQELKSPALMNLNEDPLLDGVLIFPLKEGITTVGCTTKKRDEKDLVKTDEITPSIELNGLGIVNHHCELEWSKGKVFLHCRNGQRTFVNGVQLTGTEELRHHDRVWLGNNYAFRFVYPGKEDFAREKFDPYPDYRYAEEERHKSTSKDTTTTVPETLHTNLREGLRKADQANIVARDLDKMVNFEPRIRNDELVYVVTSLQGILVWAQEKFDSRLVEMVKMWEQRFSGLMEGALSKQEPSEVDPFEDDEDQLIGQAVVMTGLPNMVEQEVSAPIHDILTSDRAGVLQVEVNPLDEKGNEGPWEDSDNEDLDPFVSSPEELIGKRIKWIVKVKKLVFDVDVLRNNFRFERCWVRYKVNTKDPAEEWTYLPPIEEAQFGKEVSFSGKHEKVVDREYLEHLKTNPATFEIWGKRNAKQGWFRRLSSRGSWKGQPPFEETASTKSKTPPRAGTPRTPPKQPSPSRSHCEEGTQTNPGSPLNASNGLWASPTGWPSLPAQSADLPPGWKQVVAYQGPNGVLQLHHPSTAPKPPSPTMGPMRPISPKNRVSPGVTPPRSRLSPLSAGSPEARKGNTLRLFGGDGVGLLAPSSRGLDSPQLSATSSPVRRNPLFNRLPGSPQATTSS